jgi:hypothetical protein
MSDLSYFKEYEARRARRRIHIVNGSSHTLTGISTAHPLTVATYPVNANSSGYTWTASCNSFVSGVGYPEYRLKKQYTFIDSIRVLADCTLEVKEQGSTNWEEVPTNFNEYV